MSPDKTATKNVLYCYHHFYTFYNGNVIYHSKGGKMIILEIGVLTAIVVMCLLRLGKLFDQYNKDDK